MVTEIIKGCIAILLVAGAILSFVIGDTMAQEFLIPLAGFVFGYYFKQAVEEPVARGAKALLGRK